MKAHKVLSIWRLLFCRTMANLSGTDDFDDNLLDPVKWIPYGPNPGLLNETNEHLAFFSTGIGHEQDAWIWNLTAGRYIQDWFVAVEAVNLSLGQQLAGIGLVVGNAFDSAVKVLASSYDIGNGCFVLTNLNVAGRTMTDTDFFSAPVNEWFEAHSVTANILYADNFQDVTIPQLVDLSICTVVAIRWFAAGGATCQAQSSTDLPSGNRIRSGRAQNGDGSAIIDWARSETARTGSVVSRPRSLPVEDAGMKWKSVTQRLPHR